MDDDGVDAKQLNRMMELGQEGLSPAEAWGKMGLNFSDPKNIKLLTRLKPKEIKELAILITIAKIRKSEVLMEFCTTYMELMVSEDGKGRKEAQAILAQTPTTSEKFGKLKSLTKYFKRKSKDEPQESVKA